MGAWTSRQNAGVEEVDVVSNYAYKYPPRCGNYFGSHFIMGGERFDTPQPEAYLFGENADLNFLGSRPIPFPYPPPQANEPTKTLKSLVNIRKESLRFVRAPPDCGKIALDETGVVQTERDVETGKVALFNIEFTFDCDSRCAITIHYFCTEEVTATGVVYTPRDPNMNSETFRYKRGANQQFCQPLHVFDPTRYSEEELLYNSDKEVIPIAIHCVAEEAGDEPRQSHTTIAVVEKHSDGTYVLKALKQKLFVDGLCYLLQEIYGIENKNNDGKVATCDTDDTEDNGSECVICMSDVRDTLILPCRHLCLCNSCADSLRYQANNCPICRAPFRALLQIRALQKTTQRQVPPASPPTNDGSCENIPAGYEAVSLIEALNGPCAPRQPPSAPCELIETPDTEAAVQAAEILNRSALEGATDNGSPDESELGKSPRDRLLGGSGSCTTPEFRMSVLLQHDEEGKETTRSPLLSGHRSTQYSRGNKTNRCPGDTLKLINEKLPTTRKEEDEDSEGEKMSPLLEGENSDRPPHHLATELKSINDTDTEHDEPATVHSVERADTDKHSMRKEDNVVSSERADDSDYYTPEEPAPMVLSPLYSTGKERERPNTAPPSGGGLDSTESTPMRHPLGASLPGTPLSHVSVRSSGDSYSSSSSTKQLLTIANGNVQDAAASKAMHV